MNRGDISGLFRKLGLSRIADDIRFRVMKFKHRDKNRQFKTAYPDVALPPDYLIYESFQMDYDKYYHGGKRTAAWLVGHFEQHKEPKNLSVLDWGCGPGRTIRHLPDLMPDGNKFYGTDVNRRSVAWCRKHIPRVDFRTNELHPPLDFAAAQMDVVYAVSIITHLSEDNQIKWLQEIKRVLRPGGIFLLTSHGEVFKTIMTQTERDRYERDEIVIRGNTTEGHRVYGAFHPPAKMRELFGRYFKILSHEPGKIVNGKPLQDVWVLVKE